MLTHAKIHRDTLEHLVRPGFRHLDRPSVAPLDDRKAMLVLVKLTCKNQTMDYKNDVSPHNNIRTRWGDLASWSKGFPATNGDLHVRHFPESTWNMGPVAAGLSVNPRLRSW